MVKIKEFIMKNETLKMKFKGSDEISLQTLSDSLSDVIKTLEVIADNSLEEHEYCKFVVRNVEKGSFIIEIAQIIENNIEPLTIALPYIPTVLESFKNILDIRKFLKGSLPKKVEKSGDDYRIENNYGQQIVVNGCTFNTYVNYPRVENKLANLSKTVEDDSDRTGLDFDFDFDGKRESVSYSVQELRETSKPIDVLGIKTDRIKEETKLWLQVKKPDLNGNGKWMFKRRGRNCEAIIGDQVFREKVKNGEINFNANTMMYVRMEEFYENNRLVEARIIEVLECKDIH